MNAFVDADYALAYPDGYKHHYWYVVRDQVVLEALRKSCASGAKCMDIGCGRGHFVGVLRAHGFDAGGVELGQPAVLEEAAPFVRTGIGFQDLSALERQNVTCVLLLDVIEHLPDPVAFLRDVRHSFPDLKSLIVTVPARQEIWSNYDERYGHFKRYSFGLAQKEIEQAGFRVGSMRYFFRTLYLAALLKKLFGSKREVVHAAPRRLKWHRWLGNIFWMETKLAPEWIFGSSLLVTATADASS